MIKQKKVSNKTILKERICLYNSLSFSSRDLSPSSNSWQLLFNSTTILQSSWLFCFWDVITCSLRRRNAFNVFSNSGSRILLNFSVSPFTFFCSWWRERKTTRWGCWFEWECHAQTFTYNYTKDTNVKYALKTSYTSDISELEPPIILAARDISEDVVHWASLPYSFFLPRRSCNIIITDK